MGRWKDFTLSKKKDFTLSRENSQVTVQLELHHQFSWLSGWPHSYTRRRQRRREGR
jgi:hypothetical protein